MHDSLLQIKQQDGSCKGLFCPDCGLINKCHIRPDLEPYTTVEEVRAERLKWIEEITGND